MLSLPRKQRLSGSAPETGAALPFGGAAPFPLVVLPGREGSAGGQSAGRDVFDAYVRREAAPELSPRQALVQALAGNDFPWKGRGSGAQAVLDASSAAGVATAQSSPMTPPAAPAPTGAVKARAKLRIATRAASTPPFPMPASVSENASSPAAGSPPASESGPMPALAPLELTSEWLEGDTSAPMLPIPEFKALPTVPGAGGISLGEPKPGATRAPWMVAPAPAPMPVIGGGVKLPVAPVMPEPPRRRMAGPVIAGLLAVALVVGVGEWWRRNERTKASERAAAAARALPPAPPPAPVAPSPQEASIAFRAWASAAKISGVRARGSDQVRALVNGRLAVDGDLVDATLGLRLVGHNLADRRLIFEERGGARLEVEY